ncbi:acetyl-CoA carboxylase biotin carboxylase subunit [Acidobacteriota bacterium]
MFSKILVANRGEIALRVILTAKQLGLKSVIVHSTADANSLPVKFADEAVCIGPPPSTDSYLNIFNILSAAEITGADAIHPGFGFLSENIKFAKACEEQNIAFIGPPLEIVSKMGNKSVAKQEMIDAGIPVVPGSDGNVESVDHALSVAKEIGYPVILKAALGGGGRGMKIVRDDKHMKEELEIARAEAQTAFEDSAVYIEKYIENPRHIEFQLLGDKFGNVVHLGERECSIQRRHQKLIEESPSVAVNPALREKMGAMAVKAAKRLNFHNVSTIEFLLDQDESFYFMEMNTRIQVEHAVTGLVTNKDLIKEQILSTMGEKLRFSQKDVVFLGHAIECRINAEDPDNDFLPCAGKITGYHAPTGTGVRVDSHVFENYEIPPYYDSLISKLLVLGNDRIDAIIKTKFALSEYVILGINTNLSLQLDIISHERFITGEFNTNFLDEFLKERSEQQ